MARIRSVKPEFWDDRKLALRVSRDGRLLYIGLWNFSDEWGRCIGDSHWIKGKIFPYDDNIDAAVITKLIDELAALNRVLRYEADEDPYLLLPFLLKHQRLETGTVPSRYPEPPAEYAHVHDLYVAHAAATQRDTKKSARGADESARRADDSALFYVAGGRGQVASSKGQGDSAATPPGAATPRPARKTRGASNNAGDVIAAFVEGAVDAGLDRPPEDIRKRIGAAAVRLLGEGYALERLVDSARRMGSTPYNDLAVQVRKDDPAAQVDRGGSTTDDRVRGHIQAGIDAQAILDAAGSTT